MSTRPQKKKKKERADFKLSKIQKYPEWSRSSKLLRIFWWFQSSEQLLVVGAASSRTEPFLLDRSGAGAIFSTTNSGSGSLAKITEKAGRCCLGGRSGAVAKRAVSAWSER